MTPAQDLFPGFSNQRLATQGAEIFARVGGSGPPLLLLHGYPQSHVMWHRVAQRLAAHFTVVAADLRGYGQSSCPPTDLEHRPYSKRAMAVDMVEVMAKLGHKRFSIMGHDRGARVAYRLALDHPEAVDRLVILDIVSTLDQWQADSKEAKIRMFHWGFLAQPAPLPEGLIRRAPRDWVEGPFKRGTKAQTLSAIDPRALEAYQAAFMDPDHVHATCEDYRAGASCDLDDDQADLGQGRTIASPMLFLWGSRGSPSDIAQPLDLWRRWCPHVEGDTIESGHFIAEENPDALLARALPFLLGGTEAST